MFGASVHRLAAFLAAAAAGSGSCGMTLAADAQAFTPRSRRCPAVAEVSPSVSPHSSIASEG